jgi:division protein CdvB (Snf7/Vps24/ESCRT-III family)
MEQRMVQRFDAFEARFSALEQRQARLEGIMEGIRDMLSRIPLVN